MLFKFLFFWIYRILHFNFYILNQYFPFAVSLAAFTADIVFILQRFHNSLDRCNGFSGLCCNFLLFYRRVLRDQF